MRPQAPALKLNYPMAQTNDRLKTVFSRDFLIDLSGLSALAVVCILSELNIVPMWFAVVLVTLAAAFSTKRKILGTVLGAVLFLLLIFFNSLYRGNLGFIEKLRDVSTFGGETGSRIAFCVLVYLIASLIFALIKQLRVRNEHRC